MRVKITDPLGGEPLSIQTYGLDTIGSLAARAARRLGLAPPQWRRYWTLRRDGTMLLQAQTPGDAGLADGDTLELIDVTMDGGSDGEN